MKSVRLGAIGDELPASRGGVLSGRVPYLADGDVVEIDGLGRQRQVFRRQG